MLLARRTVLLIVSAGLLLLAQIGSPMSFALAQPASRLATLAIDIWPEYDRPASVLVIYRGQFVPDAPIPAQVTLRIPASAEAPSAVASPPPGSETASVNQWTELVSAKRVTTTRDGDWIQVTFTPLSRLFNIEFYDKISTVTFDRSYKLTWPGDLAADAVTLSVREPFGASNFQFTPGLPPGTTDDEGLVVHPLKLGAFEAGKSFAFSASYTRQDKRPSTEALQLATPAPTPVPATAAPTSTQTWLFIVALAVGLALIAGGVVWYIRTQQTSGFHPYEPPALRKGRRSVRTSRAPRARPRPTVALNPETVESEAGFCTQCAKPLRPDDLFCPRCGTRVKGK